MSVQPEEAETSGASEEGQGSVYDVERSLRNAAFSVISDQVESDVRTVREGPLGAAVENCQCQK